MIAGTPSRLTFAIASARSSRPLAHVLRLTMYESIDKINSEVALQATYAKPVRREKEEDASRRVGAVF
jgi:hypothetical protein